MFTTAVKHQCIKTTLGTVNKVKLVLLQGYQMSKRDIGQSFSRNWPKLATLKLQNDYQMAQTMLYMLHFSFGENLEHYKLMYRTFIINMIIQGYISIFGCSKLYYKRLYPPPLFWQSAAGGFIVDYYKAPTTIA